MWGAIAEDYGSELDLVGPATLRLQYMTSDKFGIGLDFNYTSRTTSVKDVAYSSDPLNPMLDGVLLEDGSRCLEVKTLQELCRDYHLSFWKPLYDHPDVTAQTYLFIFEQFLSIGILRNIKCG